MLVDFLVHKGVLTIIPAEKCFFAAVDFENDVKLSYASVLFNYQSLSPFKESAVSYLQKNGKLLLWFYDASLRRVWSVPEGYFFHHHFRQLEKPTLIHIENRVLLVIANHTLLYESVCRENLCEEKSLLVKKYRIDEVIEKPESWYRENSRKLHHVPLHLLLLHFLDRTLFLDLLKKRMAAYLVPLAIFTALITAAQFGAGYYLHEAHSDIAKEKRETQKALKTVMLQIGENKREVETIKNYLARYEKFNSRILTDMAELLHRYKAHLYYYIHNPLELTLRMHCYDIENFLSDLSGMGWVESYKLTRQKKLDQNQSDIGMKIKLRALDVQQ